VGVLVGPVAEALVEVIVGRQLSELFGGDEGLCLGLTVGKLVGRDVAFYGGFIDGLACYLLWGSSSISR
jgi:hypothetical protein